MILVHDCTHKLIKQPIFLLTHLRAQIHILLTQNLCIGLSREPSQYNTLYCEQQP
jgi:hypothetical protein